MAGLQRSELFLQGCPITTQGDRRVGYLIGAEERQHDSAILCGQALHETTGKHLGPLQTRLLSIAILHAQTIVHQDHRRLWWREGGSLHSAPSHVWPGKHKSEQEDGRNAEGQEQPLVEAKLACSAFIRQEETAHGGKAMYHGPAPVNEMNNHGH